MEENIGEPEKYNGPTHEQGFYRYGLVVGSAAFVTTIAQMEIIGQLPIRYLLKNHLGVAPEQMSLFLLLATIAWYVKPLAGLISDSVPLFGTRRRHYLMISSALAGVCWLAMAAVPRTYYPILLTAIVLNFMMVMASTVMGGLLVEEAQRFQATGRLSSLREGVEMFAGAAGLLVGGYLAEIAFGWTPVVAASFLFALALFVFFFLDEKPVARKNKKAWSEARSNVSNLLHSRTLLTASALLFLFYMAPGIGTPLYYLQTNTLKFSQAFIGWQSVISGATGVIGALAYARACKVFRLGYLLAAGIVLNALSTGLYIEYHSRDSAMIIVAANGLLSTFGVLPLFDLATRATPKGCEGLGFAVMMSLRNFALASADWIGSWLMESLDWPFESLVIINASTTLMVLFAIPFLPYELLSQRETDSSGSISQTLSD